MQSLIWAIILQGVLLIMGFLLSAQVVGFFIPASRLEEKEFFMLYGSSYITNAPLLPIIMIPY